MSDPTSSGFFTSLVEPGDSVTQSTPSAPFDAAMAYLLGQCCSLTYNQFDSSFSLANFSLDLSGGLSGYTATPSNLEPFTTWESNEPGAAANNAGDYFQVPAGFAVQLNLTSADKKTSEDIVVIALRGSRTWDEWINDAEAFPTPFAGQAPFTYGLGSVHAGFYVHYTIGTYGKPAPSGKELDPNLRASGSIAAQVETYLQPFKPLPEKPPIYVTGHSLGGALATLAALDMATNFSDTFSALYMYSLASPRVAVGMATAGIDLLALGNEELFLANYQKAVPNSYQIVHAADIVPILPSASFKLGPVVVSCAQVTDSYQIGSGATATATINDGGVNGVTVNNDLSTGYSNDFPPSVAFSGGGGSGAIAVAKLKDDILKLKKEVTVQVTSSGSGYTSPPTVTILSGGNLAGNVIGFCAQTGDLAGNHSCTGVYVPYLEQLAASFQPS